MTKKKKEWGIIGLPLAVFAVCIYVPWFPTAYIIWTGASNIWLVLTIGWAISWYVGFVLWVQDYEKRKKPEQLIDKGE